MYNHKETNKQLQRGNKRFFLSLSVSLLSLCMCMLCFSGAAEALHYNISINDVSVDEGDGTAVFTISLSNTVLAGDSPVTVDYATANNTAVAPGDYTAVSDTLTFVTGENSKQIIITINNDSIVENQEIFHVNLSNASSGGGATAITDSGGVGTITNDDAATFAIGDFTYNEGIAGGTMYPFTVTLTGDVDQSVTVDCATADGTATTVDSDYTAVISTLTFEGNDGETKTFNVSVTGDTKVEDDETFTVGLSNVGAGGKNVTISDATGVGTITNDDTATLTITDMTKNEGTGTGTTNFDFTVTSPKAVQGGFTVAFTTNDGTAGADRDYTDNDSTVNFAGTLNETQTITVVVAADYMVEADEDFTVVLGALSNIDPSAADDITTGAAGTGMITNDDTTTVDISGGNAAEPTTNGVFGLGMMNTSQTATVISYTVTGDATSDGDYTALSGSVTIDADRGTGQIDVYVIDDILVEDDEDVIVTLTGITSGNAGISLNTTPATVTISDDDAATVSITATDAAAAEPGGAGNDGQFTVLMTKQSDTATVISYTVTGDATSGSDYTAIGASVTIPANTSSKTIDISVLDDNLVEDNETVTVTLIAITSGDANISIGAPNSDTVTIADDDSAEFTIKQDESGNEDVVTAVMFTIELSNPVDEPTSVTVSTTDGTAIAGSDYTGLTNFVVNFAEGSTSEMFLVDATADSTVEADETFTVALGTVTGGHGSVTASVTTRTGTITDDDTATFTIDDVSVNESAGTMTFTVSLDKALDIPVVVDVSYADGTATGGGTDYDSAAVQVTFTAGDTADKTVTVAITDDNAGEETETFTASLSTATALGDRSVVMTDTGTGTIYDNDYTITINNIKVLENVGNATFTVTIFPGLRAADTVTVNYATADGTAVAGSDYSASTGTVTINTMGATTGIFTVPIINDLDVEVAETFVVNLSGATPGGRTNISDSQGQCMINSDDIGTEEETVGSSSDDAEEYDVGDMYLNSSDLELVDEGGSHQTVGVRFQNINIPQGSFIVDAYIQFTTDELDIGPTSLTIHGQDIDNAPTFTSDPYNITSRTTTSESASWSSIPAWDTVGEAGANQQTPDLKNIVQQIVGRAGWSNGNAMVFIFSGSGERTAESYDGSADPLLHIKYLPGSFSMIDVDKTSLEPEAFVGYDAPSDSFTLSNVGNDTMNYTITHDVTWLSCSPGSGSLAAEGSQAITVDYDTDALAVGTYTAIITIADPDAPNTPVTIDVTLTVSPPQPVISTDRNYIGTVCYGGNNAISETFTLSNTGTDTLNYTISDDASWLCCSSASGTLAVDASVELTVSFANSSLTPDTYEATITIADPNATTSSPYEIDVSITIQPIPESSACGDVPVYTENLVSPAMLVLLDVSGSMTSEMNVSDPEDNPKTPDLSPVVQEIVNGAWASGNDMAFIITGTGHRTADSVSYGRIAPLLHLEYGGETVEIRVSSYTDTAEEKSGGGSVRVNDQDLELVDDTHPSYPSLDQTVGIRFQNVPIPNGSAITNAYIEFVINESQSEPTNLIIHGELGDADTFTTTSGNVSGRTQTIASVAWSDIPEWIVTTRQSRIDIAKDVISELVVDRSISWGFGTWCFDNDEGYVSGEDFTRVHVGCKYHDDTHQTNLQAAITNAHAYGGTPLGPSLVAAKKYFQGVKADEIGDGELFESYDCQPRFLINVTDGLGYSPHTTVQLMEDYTHDLYDENVSAVALGFGLDDATQLNKMAVTANDRGDDDPDDYLFALHDEVDGVAQPFMAQSKAGLLEALQTITGSVKAQVFHGSSPAPTTSVDYGDIVITATFDATDWSGDLVATQYDAQAGAMGTDLWLASENMPGEATLKANAWTVLSGTQVHYIDSTLLTDNYICKSLGDIIDSTPIIVEGPPFGYTFDDYETFKYSNLSREKIVYIGVNDGALHAFGLADGIEKWRFYPESVHTTLNKAQDTTEPDYTQWDMCHDEYCHRYFVNGSPVVGDIYDDTDGWKTILVCGLREGGKAYFALDITTGKTFDDTNPSSFLWEYTDTELGQTWADSTIDRVADGSDKEWAVFFGSGYADPDAIAPDNQANKESYLYGLVANDGSKLWKDADMNAIDRIKMSPSGTLAYDDLTSVFTVGEVVTGGTSGATGTIDNVVDSTLELSGVSGTFQDNENLTDSNTPTSGAATVNGTLTGALLDDALSPPMVVDFEGNYVGEYIYAGNLYGTMYRVTDIGKDETPVVTKLFDFGEDPPNHNHPIRAKADYGYADTTGNIWVYFGTGRYEEQVDKGSNHQQYFFGLKDDDTGTIEYSSLSDVPVELHAAFMVDDISQGGSGETYRIITGSNPDYESWVVLFDPEPGQLSSERVISQPLVVGSIVFFTTFKPDDDICAGNGDAWLFALDYKTGLPPGTPVFDINNDQKFDEDDQIVDDEGVKYRVASISIGSGQPSKPVLHKDTLFITTTGGGLVPVKVNLPETRGRLRSWKENVF